jgi:hypothetical protein
MAIPKKMVSGAPVLPERGSGNEAKLPPPASISSDRSVCGVEERVLGYHPAATAWSDGEKGSKMKGASRNCWARPNLSHHSCSTIVTIH